MISNMENIKRACLEIAYDSGMINRYALEADVLAEMLQRVEKKFSWGDICLVEAELSVLDDHQFEEAIWGNGITYLTNDLLNAAFEGVE